MSTPDKVIVREESEGPVFIYYWRDWGFFYFAIIGLTFLGFIIWILLTNPWDYPPEGRLFSLLPLAFGLGLTYWPLGRVINRTEICMQQGRLLVRHKPLPWRYQADLPLSDIQEIRWAGAGLSAFIKVGSQPGKGIILISKLEPPAGEFLEQEIEAHLGLRPALSIVERETAVQLSRQEEKRRDTREGKGAVLILTSLFFLLAILGVVLLVSTYSQQREARASLSWPATQGVVSENYIEQHTQENDNGPDTVSYEPIVIYSYLVNDQTYTSNRINLSAPWGYSFGNQEEAAKFLENYPIGARLKVYYNPGQPNRALLDRKQPGDPTLVYIFGWALLGLIPLALLIIVLWARSLCHAEGRPEDWKRWLFWQEQFKVSVWTR